METESQTQKDIAKFLEHMPMQSKDETLALLKGQLLVEDLLREYCASRVVDSAQLAKARLSFDQAEHLCRSLLKYPTKDWVCGAAGKLNSLRNDLAHQLTPKDFGERQAEFVRLVFSEKKPSTEFLAAFKTPQREVVPMCKAPWLGNAVAQF